MKLPIKNSAWAFLESAVNPVVNLILTPIMLKYIGIHQFGLWVFSLALTSLGQLASFGVGFAVIKNISVVESILVDRRVSIVRSGLMIVMLGSFAIIVMSLFVALFFSGVIFEKMGSAYEVRYVILISALAACAYLFDELAVSTLHGMQQYAHSAYFSIFFYFVGLLGTLIILINGYNVFIVIAWSALLRALKFVSIIIFLNKQYFQDKFFINFFVIEKNEIFSLVNFGKWQFMQSVGAALFNVFDRMLIGSYLGSSSLSIYGVCMQLAQFVQTVATASMKVLFPWSSSLQRSLDGKLPDVFKLTLVSGLLCLILPLIIFPFVEQILTFWVGKEFSENNYHLAALLVVACGLLALNVPAHFVLMGLGKIRLVSFVNILAGVASSLSMLLLVSWGLKGIAFSKILFSLFILYNFFTLYQYIKGSKRV